MVIKAGTQVTIIHRRYGTFAAKAQRDFNIADPWWPVVVEEKVLGMARKWEPGEAIPCRRADANLEVAA